MKQERLDPGWAWTKKYNISAGVKLGDTVQLSGIVALDGEGNIIGVGDNRWSLLKIIIFWKPVWFLRILNDLMIDDIGNPEF